ncbi:MAG: UbiA family prenyltransferase [Desulfobacterales bacterium]|nr:UbiA family prenyltransferase [Desulfobacterales bacterium]
MSGNPVILPDTPTGGRLTLSFKALLELTKCHLSLYIALSATSGHVLAAGRFSLDSLIIGGLTLLLSCGSAVLNNIQDRVWDNGSARTRTRVLVTHCNMAPRAAVLAAVLIFSGLGGLFFFCASPVPFYLGTAAIGLYNGLYTPLKKYTLWAMVPGTLCGMIPPAMGWTAVPTGISASDVSGLWIVMAALGFWQLPHYLLISLRHSVVDDGGQGGGSERPGFNQIWSPEEIRWQVLIWTGLFSLSMILFQVKGWIVSPGLAIGNMAVAVLLPFAMGGMLTPAGGKRRTGLCLAMINLSMLGFLSIAVLDRI